MNMAINMGDVKGYRWETGYEKSWEEISENEQGLTALTDSLAKLEYRKRKQQDGNIVRLGMMRHLIVVVDCSESMLDQDLKPTRHVCTFNLLREFLREFVEQNPLSQVGVVVTRQRRAERVCEPSGNPRKLLRQLEVCEVPAFCIGEPSLQNALELAYGSLKLLPAHTSREILVLYASLNTCDPSNIKTTIQNLKTNGVRCSIIGLCAEVRLLKFVSSETGGEYQVVLNDGHYQELLRHYVKPRAVPSDADATCVKMGFPHNLDKVPPFANCMCHGEELGASKAGYLCPQCASKYCELPTECTTCGITLVTSAHLVRPLHHLVPIAHFRDVINSPPSDQQLLSQRGQCYACRKPLTQDMQQQITMCSDCKQLYCLDCDSFIHNVLHVCPGCAVNSK